MKGVPLRLELGPRDLEGGVVTAARRDTTEKTTLPLSGIAETVKNVLDTVHNDMFAAAKRFMDSHIKPVSTLDELGAAVENGWALADWCGDRACEDKIKEQFQATSRNMPFDQSTLGKTCVCCGKKAKHKIYFGKAY